MATHRRPELTKGLRAAIVEAINRAQNNIRWKPGKSVQHLAKRIRLGHLPAGATLLEYETIIAAVLHSTNANLYLFFHDDTPYPTLVALIEGIDWLVMVGLDGVIETAFPPSNPDHYLADPAFVFVGLFKELPE